MARKRLPVSSEEIADSRNDNEQKCNDSFGGELIEITRSVDLLIINLRSFRFCSPAREEEMTDGHGWADGRNRTDGQAGN